MALNVGDLVINVRANTADFRRAMGQTVALTESVSQKLKGFSERTATLGGTGIGGFFDPSGQAKGFIDTARAMEIYQGEVRGLISDLQVFSSTLNKIQSPLFSFRNQTSDLVPVVRRATAATTEHAKALNFAQTAFVRIAPATALAAAGYTELVSRSNFLTAALRQLNLVNFNVFTSFERWNTLDVLAGPGRLVQLFDRLKVAVLGGTSPIRALQFALGLLLPGIESAGKALIRNAQDESTKKFGANLLKIANDIKNLGAGFTPRPTLIVINAIKSGFQGLATTVRAADRVLTPTIQGIGYILARLVSVRSFSDLGRVFSASASAAGGLFVALQKIAGLTINATLRALDFSLVSMYRSLRFATQGAVSLGVSLFGVARSALSAGASLLGLNRSAETMGRLASNSRAAQGFIFGLAGLGPGITLLAQGGIRMAGAFGLATSSIAAFRSAASFEQTALSFATMLGSAERARDVLEDLNRFSDITPFEPGPVIESGRFLLTAGVAAEDLRRTLKAIGDVASGVNAPIEEIAQKYARVRTENRLTGEILTQLGERGIPVAAELARMYGVTEAAVRDLASEGRIGIAALDQAFQNLSGSGGKFENLMQRQSTTVNGLLSTLVGKSKNAIRGIGQGLIDVFNVKGILTSIIQLQTSFGDVLQNAIVGAARSGAKALGGLLVPAIAFVRENMDVLKSVFSATFRFLGEASVAAWNVVVAGAQGFFSFTTDLFSRLFGTNATASIQNWSDFLRDALILAEFGFTNWEQIAQAALSNLAVGFLRLSESAIDLGQTILDYTLNPITKLGVALGNILTNLGIAVTGSPEEFVGLTEGLNSQLITVSEEFRERLREAIEFATAANNAVNTNLASDASAFLAQRREELDKLKKNAERSVGAPDAPDIKLPDAPKVPDLLDPKKKKERGEGRQELNTAVEAGSSEAFRAIAESRRGGDAQERPIERRNEAIQRQHLKHLQRIAEQLDPNRRRKKRAVYL